MGTFWDKENGVIPGRNTIQDVPAGILLSLGIAHAQVPGGHTQPCGFCFGALGALEELL